MSIVFVSNYINHHQIPLSDAMYAISGGDYHFIQTVPMEQERIALGWDPVAKEKEYVSCYYEKPKKCQQIIDSADAVIFGGTTDESYIQERLRTGKLVIRYDERIYKTGQWRAISPKGLIHKYHDHIRYRKSNVYMLCAGTYVASDFHLIHAYPNKMLRFGYFPSVKVYDGTLNELRDTNSCVNILWTGRFIDWKHPIMMVELAERLINEKIEASITMVGDGTQKDFICRQIKERGLENKIRLTGAVSPEEVRTYMRTADIYAFTSDRKEGWGAVLSEAMNSGAAVVASHLAGASAYLVRNGQNGFMYRTGDFNDFYQKIKLLILHDEKRKQMGENAYLTMKNVWNANTAASRLYKFIHDPEHKIISYEDKGPMTPAPVWSERAVAKMAGENYDD